MLNLSYPDQVYSSDNPPSNETLKADLSLIEAGHNALETEVNALQALVMEAVYPVGSVYTNKTVSTNPATLFGFGTWVAIAGRVVVGLDAGQTEFDTAGKEGGENTHLLTSAESGLPAHNHPSDSSVIRYIGTGGDGDYITPGSELKGDDAIVQNNTAANASSAHNNLQPYVVCYVWERTA